MSNGLRKVWENLTGAVEEKEEGGRKKLKKEQWFVIALCGVLLILLAVPAGKKEKEKPLINLEKPAETMVENGRSQESAEDLTPEEYADLLERKLEESLSLMEGVGKVKVVINLASSTEKIVEKEQPVNRSNTAETDAQGGSRNINTVEMGDTAVYSTQSGQATPYVVKVLQPKVEGVMVVAQGAGKGNVNKNITEAVQVLFGLEAHKIKVLKMKTSVE